MIKIDNKQYNLREHISLADKMQIKKVYDIIKPYYPYLESNVPMIVDSGWLDNFHYSVINNEFQLIQNKESNLSFSNREKVEKCFNAIYEEIK